MAGVKKDGDDNFNGITIEVDGEVIGKIKKWDPKPLDEKGSWPKKCTDFVSMFPSCGRPTPGMHQISFPAGALSEFWGKEIPVATSSGKSTLGLTALGKLLAPGHLYIRAQLEMWGVTKTRTVCVDCLSEIVTTLEDMGYNVWFDQKSSIDEELAEAHGIVVHDYKLEYVGRGDEEESSS